MSEPRTWSTARLPDPERFPFWREVVWDAFVPVSLKRRDEGTFAGSVTARSVGPLGVATIESQPQSVSRGESEIQRRAGDVFFLNLPLAEGTFASQDGRTAHLEPGDFAIVDSSRPFELGFEREFHQLSLTIPQELLMPLLAAPHEATAVRVRGDHGVGAIAGAAIRALVDSGTGVDREAGRAVAGQLGGLIALALGNSVVPPASAGRGLLLQAAIDEIERSLGDIELSPGVVAQRIGVSTRYLHQLFADRGRSFGRWVLARRLERCHRDLGDPARSHWTVASIATHHGFRDPSYFARAFRIRYGIGPRDYRRTLTAAARSPHPQSTVAG